MWTIIRYTDQGLLLQPSVQFRLFVNFLSFGASEFLLNLEKVLDWLLWLSGNGSDLDGGLANLFDLSLSFVLSLLLKDETQISLLQEQVNVWIRVFFFARLDLLFLDHDVCLLSQFDTDLTELVQELINLVLSLFGALGNSLWNMSKELLIVLLDFNRVKNLALTRWSNRKASFFPDFNLFLGIFSWNKFPSLVTEIVLLNLWIHGVAEVLHIDS